MKFKFKAKYVLPVVILVAGFFIMQFLFGFAKEPEKKKPIPVTKLVESKVVKLETVVPEITAFGRLTSSQPITLVSEVSGTVLKGDVPFLPGQSFKKGDLIVKIDDRQIKLDINSAKSDFLTALAAVLPEIKVDFSAEFKTWQNYFDNCSFDKKLSELPKPANQKIKLFLSRFNVYKLYFTVENLEIRLEKHYFYAPFNGSISRADLRIGSTARSGSVLGEIINLDDMELEVPVPTKDLQWIDPTKPVVVKSKEIEGSWKGRITRIGESINIQTQTLQAFISIEGSAKDRLYNGIFLEAFIPGRAIESAMTIPRKAMYNGKYVFIVENGKLDYREINVARMGLNDAVINAGIKNGDTLVTEVLQGVADGMPAKALIQNDGVNE